MKELAAVLPEMAEWIFPVAREADVHPVLSFREYLKGIRLLRKHKGSLLATRLGTAAAADPEVLWGHLADTLVPAGDDFETAASVLVLAHTETEQSGRIDLSAIARALGELGWQHRDGSPVSVREVWPVVNDIWTAVGNVGPARGGPRRERVPSREAVLLIRDALFSDVTAGGGVGDERR